MLRLTMRKSKLRAAAGVLPWIMALSLTGCQPARQQTAAAEDPAPAETAGAVDEAQGVAEASLGKQAEILVRGDLALNGREQLLVINRFSSGARASKMDGSPSPIIVTRAAVLEKKDDKWSQILLCDEHLKNPSGYLGGTRAAPVNGWQLDYKQDSKDGLQMNFAPAENTGALAANSTQSSEKSRAPFHVRWNRNEKRYQSYDMTHERYLSEIPSLETPESTLK
jgi:hypothetical protein